MVKDTLARWLVGVDDTFKFSDLLDHPSRIRFVRLAVCDQLIVNRAEKRRNRSAHSDRPCREINRDLILRPRNNFARRLACETVATV
jgi:hypothetical protein